MEGGLYPGAVYQLMCWYRPDEIAVRLACLQLMGQSSGICDALICYGLGEYDPGSTSGDHLMS